MTVGRCGQNDFRMDVTYGRCENLTKPAGGNDATSAIAMGARRRRAPTATRENIAAAAYRDNNAVERLHLSSPEREVHKLFECAERFNIERTQLALIITYIFTSLSYAV